MNQQDRTEELHGLSVCSGVGGLELGVGLATRGALRTVCHVERDAFAAACLVGRMEDATLAAAPVWDDVTTFDGRPWRGLVDILTAGYPCQPFSIAGQRRGEDDPRHLWPHVRRVLGECRAPIAFFENVPRHLRVGFPPVHDDLQRMGYRVAAGLFAAAESGAPHIRERLFILAVADTSNAQWWAGVGRAQTGTRADGQRRRRPPSGQPSVGGVVLGDASGARLPRTEQRGQSDAAERGQQPGAAVAESGGAPVYPPGRSDREGWDSVGAVRPDLYPAAQPSVRGVVDGLVSRVDEPMSPLRRDRLHAVGNGVVPLAAAMAYITLWEELNR